MGVLKRVISYDPLSLQPAKFIEWLKKLTSRELVDRLKATLDFAAKRFQVVWCRKSMVHTAAFAPANIKTNVYARKREQGLCVCKIQCFIKIKCVIKSNKIKTCTKYCGFLFFFFLNMYIILIIFQSAPCSCGVCLKALSLSFSITNTHRKIVAARFSVDLVCVTSCWDIRRDLVGRQTK